MESYLSLGIFLACYICFVLFPARRSWCACIGGYTPTKEDLAGVGTRSLTILPEEEKELRESIDSLRETIEEVLKEITGLSEEEDKKQDF